MSILSLNKYSASRIQLPGSAQAIVIGAVILIFYSNLTFLTFAAPVRVKFVTGTAFSIDNLGP